MFSLICVWINGWVNNSEAGDLRRHRTHYDIIVICYRHRCLGWRLCNMFRQPAFLSLPQMTPTCPCVCFTTMRHSTIKYVEQPLCRLHSHHYTPTCRLQYPNIGDRASATTELTQIRLMPRVTLQISGTVQCTKSYFDGRVQDCSISSTLAMDILQSYNKPRINFKFIVINSNI